jgi:hypothetical protein
VTVNSAWVPVGTVTLPGETVPPGPTLLLTTTLEGVPPLLPQPAPPPRTSVQAASRIHALMLISRFTSRV